MKGMIKCYVNELTQDESDYDSIGVAYRDVNGLYIVFPSLGELKVNIVFNKI